MAQTITIHGNVGILGNSHAPANIAASSGPVNQQIDATAVLKLADEIKAAVPHYEADHDLRSNLDVLANEAGSTAPDQSKMQATLKLLKEGAASIGNSIIQSAVKAGVDRILGS